MHYYAARYYDDHLGQFISPDTIVPAATSVLSYNRFMYTRGNPLNRMDPTGHNDAIFDQYGGGGGKEALLIKAAIDLVAITIATQRATHGPPPLVAPRVPSWDEFWPQQQSQPSTTGGVPLEDHAPAGAVTTETEVSGSQATGFPLAQQPVGDNVVATHIEWRGQNTAVVGQKSSRRLRGYTEGVSDLPGGLSQASQVFEQLTGRAPKLGDQQSLAPIDTFINRGILEVHFRPDSSTGTAVLEIIDHVNKTFEKIHFNE